MVHVLYCFTATMCEKFLQPRGECFHQNVDVQLIISLSILSDEPPKITCQPLSQINVLPGNPATFTIEATGSHPLSYMWEWKQAVEGDGSEEWQPCCAEWCNETTLTIPSVNKSNEGCYRCIISNRGGDQTSKSAQLSVGKNHIFRLADSQTLV